MAGQMPIGAPGAKSARFAGHRQGNNKTTGAPQREPPVVGLPQMLCAKGLLDGGGTNKQTLKLTGGNGTPR